jgi:hypothetical protein
MALLLYSDRKWHYSLADFLTICLFGKPEFIGCLQVNPACIDGFLGDILKAAGLTVSTGPPTGYVLTFSNGLVVYQSRWY